MLYFVSGTSRSGKTLIAKKLMERTQIPYVSLDWIVMGFTNGIPEYGLHDKLWPNEIAEKLWPFLQGMLESMLWLDADYIVEGEAILPHLIKSLLDKYPDKTRIVFVGYDEISVDDKVQLVRRFSEGERDWLTKESDEYIKDHIKNMISYSKGIRSECQKHGLRYFDTSTQFEEIINQAVDCLQTGNI